MPGFGCRKKEKKTKKKHSLLDNLYGNITLMFLCSVFHLLLYFCTILIMWRGGSTGVKMGRGGGGGRGDKSICVSFLNGI